jgi:transposase
MDKESVTAKKSINPVYYIGIDVSKNKLDYAVFKGTALLFHRVGKNEPEEILKFIGSLNEVPGFKIKKALFCMEQTGIYCNHLIKCLRDAKANMVVENAMKIKNSMGNVRGKDDKIDAIRIAQYAQKNKDELKLWTARRDVMLQLMRLVAIRNRLLNISLKLKTPLKEEHIFSCKSDHAESTLACKKSTEAVMKDLKKVQKQIEKLISSDKNFKKLKELIMSVPGIGPVTATQIIITTNEFKDINNPKKFACYSGVAPFKKESGSITHKARVSHIANKKMKTLLHISAWAAVRTNKELKAYYERKTKEQGKSKMATLNAIRNKLILRVFACVKQQRKFVNDFVHSTCMVAVGHAEITGNANVVI